MYHLDSRRHRQSLVYIGNNAGTACCGGADEVVYLSCSTTSLRLRNAPRTRHDEEQVRAPLDC